jgi:hypothetical protein
MWQAAGLSETPKDVKVTYLTTTKWYKGMTRHGVSAMWHEEPRLSSTRPHQGRSPLGPPRATSSRTASGTVKTGSTELRYHNTGTGITTADLAANAATVHTKATGLPNGFNQTITSATVTADVTGATVTWTASAGSKIQFLAQGMFHHDAANGRVQLLVTDNSNVIKLSSPWMSHPTATFQFGSFIVGEIDSPGAGSVTYKLRVTVIDAGTATLYNGTFNIYATEFKR